MSAPPNFPRLLVSAERQKFTKYFNISSIALLMVDYCGTFQMEVDLMWGSERSLAKILFFISRYMALFDVALATFFHLALGVSPEDCRILFVTETTFLLIGVGVAEAILYLRVYAISGRKLWLKWYLIVQFTAVHIAIFGVYIKFAMNQKFRPSPFPTLLGCVPQPTLPELGVVLSVMFGLILVDEIVIMVMTMALGLMKYRTINSPLIKIFYRDGLFYFLTLAAVSLVNIIVNVSSLPEYRFLVVVYQRVLHSILACRMLLHMKSVGKRQKEEGAQGSEIISDRARGKADFRGGRAGRTVNSFKPAPVPPPPVSGIHIYDAYRGSPFKQQRDVEEYSDTIALTDATKFDYSSDGSRRMI